MTEPTNHRAGYRRHHHAGNRSRSCRKLTYPDHRAVRALHSAVAARLLSPDSCRRRRRIDDCDPCARWRLTSKAARA